MSGAKRTNSLSNPTFKRSRIDGGASSLIPVSNESDKHKVASHLTAEASFLDDQSRFKNNLSLRSFINGNASRLYNEVRVRAPPPPIQRLLMCLGFAGI